ncbi:MULTISPECIES: NfeD family protein [unclassified Ochrobactrum]|uniref:NfeD family protein n=1 Tax=unclassified Ochrobactrum TaxID=239106 RepID=UPI000DEED5FA|nr:MULTISPECIES: NfeD family protein [unclassified Ochrobactrum]MBQ0710428.1 NfeD family protein [Ochrobactrum sp. AP1BH01-1]
MIIEFLSGLGIWNWLVFGLVLLILEISAPGFFFIWFGLAALVTGALAFLLSSTTGFSWQFQTIVFLVLAVIFVLTGRRLFGSRSTDADEVFLNRRGEQMIGQRATLTEPIINGRGRIRINDTMWRVKGPDLPAGTEVRVIAFDPLSLEIEVTE